VFSGDGSGVDLENIAIDGDYKGPHVKFPMTLQNLQDLIDGFKRKRVRDIVLNPSCYYNQYAVLHT